MSRFMIAFENCLDTDIEKVFTLGYLQPQAFMRTHFRFCERCLFFIPKANIAGPQRGINFFQI